MTGPVAEAERTWSLRSPGNVRLIASAIFAGYLFSAFSFQNLLCPRGSFTSAPIGSLAGLGFVAGYFLLCFAVVCWAVIPSLSKIWSVRTPLLTAAIFAVGIAAFLWLKQYLSYACFLPNAIILHANPFGPAHTIGWDQVTGVEGQCGTIKARRFGTVVIALEEDEPVMLDLGGNPAEVYQPIKAALAGTHYHYVATSSVTADKCPLALYDVLLHW